MNKNYLLDIRHSTSSHTDIKDFFLSELDIKKEDLKIDKTVKLTKCKWNY